MNKQITALALAAAAWFPLSAAAAPAPEPSSEGPISDALGLRGRLPSTPPPTAGAAIAAEKGGVNLEVTVAIAISQEVVVNVPELSPDGKTVKTVQQKRVVTSMVPETRIERIQADAVKFFTVGRDGKLESIDSAKALGMLKQFTPVLYGQPAEVDPRNLEQVKPGTLYLVLPLHQPESIPVPLPPGAEKRI
ncbi:MAG TPA: hypothetical protein VMS17_08960 [Gemmataceae bacterium]|nr:hypothetical protein [Gemmataceae bacterium]